jgi:hypothetical protein
MVDRVDQPYTQIIHPLGKKAAAFTRVTEKSLREPTFLAETNQPHDLIHLPTSHSKVALLRALKDWRETRDPMKFKQIRVD